MIESKPHSICISLVHEALHGAKAQGFNIENILEKSGIELSLFNSAQARVSIQQYADLWVELANQMQDEFFGLDRRPLRRGSFRYLTKSLMYCENLQQAIQQALEFFNLLFDDLKADLSIDNQIAKVVIYDQHDTKPMFAYACYWMLLHSLMCWLSGQRIALTFIQVKSSQPVAHLDYQARFCNDIRYNTAENAMAFPAYTLKLCIKQDQQSRYRFLQATPHNLLVRFKNPLALSQHIRRGLINLNPNEWPSLSQVAQRLHMSEATLQRRLKAEGFSYQQLKNHIRRDKAISLLCHSQHSLQQISDCLNFHDPSAFHRAFKKWTGLNPGYYRSKQ